MEQTALGRAVKQYSLATILTLDFLSHGSQSMEQTALGRAVKQYSRLHAVCSVVPFAVRSPALGLA